MRLLRPVVNVIVLVSHLGLDEDEGLAATEIEVDQNEALPLAGVNLVLGGHLHIVLNPPKSIPNDEFGNQTVLAHSGAFAKFVGRLDLVVKVGEDNSDPQRRSKITAYSFKTIPVDSKVEDDAEVAELLWPYSVALNREIDLNGVLAYVDTPGDEKVVRADPTGGDSQLGNLVARAMQLRTGIEAEIAITNSLGIRADFEKGPLTVEQMFNVFPFENSITLIYLSGSEIQETLDFVARKSAERGCRSQAQVSGVTFDMVCSGRVPERRAGVRQERLPGRRLPQRRRRRRDRPQALRPDRAERPVQGGGQRLHRARRLRLRRAQAQHLEAVHHHLAARCAGRLHAPAAGLR